MQSANIITLSDCAMRPGISKFRFTYVKLVRRRQRPFDSRKRATYPRINGSLFATKQRGITRTAGSQEIHFASYEHLRLQREVKDIQGAHPTRLSSGNHWPLARASSESPIKHIGIFRSLTNMGLQMSRRSCNSASS